MDKADHPMEQTGKDCVRVPAELRLRGALLTVR